MAGQWEPDESRGSCPVLREAGAEMPRSTHALVHCETRKQAEYLRDVISRRFGQHLLRVHPQKTKIVYCKDSKRIGSHEHAQFDFLGYAFRPRLAKTRDGRYLVGFLPAMSTAAGKKIRATIGGWKLNPRSDKSIVQLAKDINPQVQGWINYFGKFYRTSKRPTLERLDAYLVRWAIRKYKRFRNRPNRARRWLSTVALEQPNLFAGIIGTGILESILFDPLYNTLFPNQTPVFQDSRKWMSRGNSPKTGVPNSIIDRGAGGTRTFGPKGEARHDLDPPHRPGQEPHIHTWEGGIRNPGHEPNWEPIDPNHPGGPLIGPHLP